MTLSLIKIDLDFYKYAAWAIYLSLDFFFFSGAAAHGTKMAGIAAAKANNGICGVGVAYDAIVSGMSTSWCPSPLLAVCW